MAMQMIWFLILGLKQFNGEENFTELIRELCVFPISKADYMIRDMSTMPVELACS